jgi:hypothetical protein
LRNFGARWDIEQPLAELTIRHPNREQSFAPDNAGSGASIFARYFIHKFPARNFWLLVAGLRSGTILHVGQVFRVYPEDVDLSKCETLADVLQEFANTFGLEVGFNGKFGKFFMFVQTNDGRPITDNFKWPACFKGRATISGLYQVLDEKTSFRLVFAINLDAYFGAVEGRHGWDKNIRSELK